jgi:hypothetical protein
MPAADVPAADVPAAVADVPAADVPEAPLPEAPLPETPALMLPPTAAMPALGGELATIPALGVATLAPPLPALACPAALVGGGLLPAGVPVETPPGWVPAGVSLPHAPQSSTAKHANALGSKGPRREVCISRNLHEAGASPRPSAQKPDGSA